MRSCAVIPMPFVDHMLTVLLKPFLAQRLSGATQQVFEDAVGYSEYDQISSILNDNSEEDWLGLAD